MNIGAGQALLVRVAQGLGRVCVWLEPVRERFGALACGGPITRQQLATLRPGISSLLRQHPALVAGAGVVTAPGLLADAEYWLEWWWAAATGEQGRLRVNLDPASPDFFDYTTADWFAMPRDTAAAHIAGPTVDYECTNQYAMTIALPVTADGAFVGVAAADVLVASLEQFVLPQLLEISRSGVLITGDGRVVASASPDYAPGLLFDAAGAQRISMPADAWAAAPAASDATAARERVPLAALDWQLVDVAGR